MLGLRMEETWTERSADWNEIGKTLCGNERKGRERAKNWFSSSGDWKTFMNQNFP